MKKANILTNRVTYGDVNEPRKPLPDWVKTPELYMPKRTPASEMSLAMAKRGLCAKSAGNLEVCRSCPAPCPMGKRSIELTDHPELAPQPVAPHKPVKMPVAKKKEAETEPRVAKGKMAAKRDMVDFPQRLMEALKKSGLTQQQVADQMGSKKCSVSSWMNGRILPSVPVVADLCRVLHVSADYLLGLEVGE